jgi:hypothetical protein
LISFFDPSLTFLLSSTNLVDGNAGSGPAVDWQNVIISLVPFYECQHKLSANTNREKKHGACQKNVTAVKRWRCPVCACAPAIQGDGGKRGFKYFRFYSGRLTWQWTTCSID